MRVRPLATVCAGLDVLLRIVPRAATVVKEARHENSSDSTDHEERCNRFRANAELLEYQSDGDREQHYECTGGDHRLQRAHCHDVDGRSVIRTFGSKHDPRTLAELATHFRDHRRRGLAYCRERQRREPEDEHRTKQTGDEYFRTRKIDLDRNTPAIVANFVQVR